MQQDKYDTATEWPITDEALTSKGAHGQADVRGDCYLPVLHEQILESCFGTKMRSALILRVLDDHLPLLGDSKSGFRFWLYFGAGTEICGFLHHFVRCSCVLIRLIVERAVLSCSDSAYVGKITTNALDMLVVCCSRSVWRMWVVCFDRRECNNSSFCRLSVCPPGKIRVHKWEAQVVSNFWVFVTKKKLMRGRDAKSGKGETLFAEYAKSSWFQRRSISVHEHQIQKKKWRCADCILRFKAPKQPTNILFCSSYEIMLELIVFCCIFLFL